MGLINKIGLTIALALMLFMVPLSALAADKYGIDATQQATGGLLPSTVAGAKTVPEVVGGIVKVALSLIGIVFFGLIFYAGFVWMTAQGNSERVESAKNTITGAAIGLIIVMAAYAVTNFVFTNLAPGGGASSNPDQACIAKGGSCQPLGPTCISPKRIGYNECTSAANLQCCY